MLAPRIIPVLLLKGRGLVKGTRFRDHSYIGDPLNAVRIFNDKEVDELIFLDIAATRENRTIDTDLVGQLADECFMPFAVGGGVRSVEQIRELLNAGAEKICLNSAALADPELILRASQTFGRQSIIVSIDVARNWRGVPSVHSHAGLRCPVPAVVEWARRCEELGAGEVLLTAVHREGGMAGYDLDLIRSVTLALGIPVLAAGGAGSPAHLREVLHQAGASGAAAGSLFVYHGPRRAVLINFPTPQERSAILYRAEPVAICR